MVYRITIVTHKGKICRASARFANKPKPSQLVRLARNEAWRVGELHGSATVVSPAGTQNSFEF